MAESSSPRALPVVELLTVSRTFDATVPVKALQSVSLEVGAGELLAIVGPSGSGKSTLLNLIGLLDSPTSGQQFMLGRDVCQDEPARAWLRATQIGFVFQSFHLMLHRTAFENVELGLVYRGTPRAARAALVRSALIAVGLEHRLFEQTRNLSGGERQRVAIARALAGRPSLIVADEPTGNLDSEASDVVVDHLLSANDGGTTVVVVTHDRNLAARFGRRVTIDDGRIVQYSAKPHAGRRSHREDDAPAPVENSGYPRALDVIRDSFAGQVSRLGKTVGLIAGVGFAVALVVMTLGLTSTAKAQVSSTFDTRMNRSVTVTFPYELSTEVTTERASTLARRLGALAGVEHAGVALEGDAARITYAGSSDKVATQTVSEAYLEAADATVTWAVGHDRRLRSREVLLGAMVADQITLGPLDAAPQIRLNGLVYSVVGIVRNGGRVPPTAGRVILALGPNDVTSHAIGVTAVARTQPGAAQQVAAQAPLALLPTSPERLEVLAPPDPSTLRDEVEGSLEGALLALSSASTLMAILFVANSLLLSVVERIGEFGLRRALGARRQHLHLLAASEATVIGLAGGAMGYFTGMTALLGFTLANGWQPVFDPGLGAIAIASGVMVGVLGGIPAAIRAGRVQPAEALRS